MKASEVLRRYQEGEKNFRGANLRGKSFKGKDLSGADLSEADIRSTNFTDANLKNTNFTGAKCGLQRRWAIFLTILSWLVAGILGFISIPVAANFLSRFDNFSNFNGPILNLVSLIVVITLSTIISRQEIRMASAILVIGVVSTATGIGLIPVGIAAIIVGFIAPAISAAVAGVIAGFIALLSSVAGVIVGIAEVLEELGLETITVAGVGALVVKGVYDGWHEIKGQERDTWIHPLVVAFSAIGGTSFYGANLTDAIFTRAKLKSTDFRLANITRVRWDKALMLNRAFSGDTYLQYAKVRQWLIGEGKDKNLDRLNLRGVNFQGNKNLTDASFIGADLSEANLQDADLSRAKLVQTQLDKTDFTGATLTGAFIEDWGITTHTKLEGVNCECVYMRLPTKENPNPRRKPDNENDKFDGDDFADFIKPIKDTLDLYHNQGVDPRAIAISWKKLVENNPEANLQFAAMEVKGKNNLLLRFKTALEADLSSLNAEYFDIYNHFKALADEESKKLIAEKDDRIQQLEKFVMTGLKSPKFQKIGKIKMSNDYSRTQNISNSTIDNSGAGAFNLGDISGTVANTINKLPNFDNKPEKQELKELLDQLQTAILATKLNEEDKAESLEQIQKIASSLTDSQDGAVKKTVKTAMKLLRGTAAALPKGSAMITICNQLPELISKIFN